MLVSFSVESQTYQYENKTDKKWTYGVFIATSALQFPLSVKQEMDLIRRYIKKLIPLVLLNILNGSRKFCLGLQRPTSSIVARFVMYSW